MGKKTRQTEKEVGRQHQGMDRLGVCQVPEGSGRHRKMEETGCEVICDAPTTPAVSRWVKMKVKLAHVLSFSMTHKIIVLQLLYEISLSN